MRLTAFLFISLSLHAAALSYPAVFLEPRVQQAIPVIILDADQARGEKSGDGRAEGGKKDGLSAKPRWFFVPTQTVQTRGSANNKKPTPESQTSSEIPPNVTSDPAGEIAMASIVAVSDVMGSFLNQSGNGAGTSNGSGDGNSRSGSGSGTGAGDGHGNTNFVQAGYSYNPKPEYPDSARREGKEGRVILRVLVDERGRSRSVEVDRSSGNAALDQAAVTAVQHWRFSPARSGDTPVETWVKIPIDFQLTDGKN